MNAWRGSRGVVVDQGPTRTPVNFVFEALFGIQGVIAAPIFCAYLESELTERGLFR